MSDSVCPMCGVKIEASDTGCRACGESLSPAANKLSQTATRWQLFNNPPRHVRLIIAGGTVWLIAYCVLFLASICVGIYFQITTGTRPSSLERWFWIVVPTNIATMVLTVGLLAYYVIYLFQSPRVAIRHRLVWLILLLLFSPFSMIPFCLLYVWPSHEDP